MTEQQKKDIAVLSACVLGILEAFAPKSIAIPKIEEIINRFGGCDDPNK